MQLIPIQTPGVKEIEVFRKEKLVARWFKIMGRMIHLGEVELETGDRIVTLFNDGSRKEIVQ